MGSDAVGDTNGSAATLAIGGQVLGFHETSADVDRVRDDLERHRHSHGADGREEFHVQPMATHGHLHCRSCGTTWEVPADEASVIVETMQRGRGFAVDLSHLSIGGLCAGCSASSQSPVGTPMMLKPPST